MAGRLRDAAALVLVALAVAAALGCGPRADPAAKAGAGAIPPGAWRAAGGEFLLGGIQVNEPDPERWIERLASAGFNTVAVTVYARQNDWDDASLRFEDEASGVASEVRAAKAAGLRVVLILRVELDSAAPRNRFLWHGMIMPRDDERVGAWFDRYREFVVRWAAIAESLGVDVLGIASEMNALASTRSVDAVPELEAYYLDPARQTELRRRVGRFERDIDARHLHGSWQQTYESVPDFIDDQIGAHRRWAEQVTYSTPGATIEQRVAAINQRRRLLAGEWAELIAAARAVYGGELTYAANFDQYTAVGFWPDLDLIGINAYFPLRRQLAAGAGAGAAGGDDAATGSSGTGSIEAELEASWRRILEELRAFRVEAGAAGLPVLFTELGYTTRAGATLEPWSSRGFSLVGSWEAPDLVVWDERERRPEERALAVRALRSSAAAVDPGLLRGLLWWKLSTVTGHGTIEPFVLLIGEDAPADPLAPELRAFRDE